MQRRAFRAMGTEIELFVDAPRADPALVEAEAVTTDGRTTTAGGLR